MRISRSFDASPQELREAFTLTERLRRWFRPAPDVPVAAAQAVDGGSALRFATPAGDVTLTFRWQTNEPGGALVGTLRQQDPRGTHDSQLTVTFGRDAAGSSVTVQHDGMPEQQLAEAEAGWRFALGRLIAGCPRAVDEYYARLTGQPGYRSPFGGLWPDRPDAAAELAARQASGALDEADAARFAHWIERGFVVLPQAVTGADIDQLTDDVARDWRAGNPAVTIELCDGDGGYHRMLPEWRDRPSKVLDYHGVRESARRIQFAPAIRRFLRQLFERPPMATQSLLFTYGTEQAMHQDTAYVVMRSPMEFVGCWVALEDIVPGSGELQYYSGSHRIPEYLWLGRSRARPPGYEDHGEFLDWVRRHSEERGCELVRFLPKKGDAVIWHADLVHGGSRRELREQTRRSLVTHYCPVDVAPAWMDDRHPRHRHGDDAYYCHMMV
ncbi:MAG: phytanoyl-CoA dioxygenase family protein [Planctomycetes bacterium]|nr:phytanoyl-CoA dioxygenase family protein [Planctomycetota bacterium]